MKRPFAAAIAAALLVPSAALAHQAFFAQGIEDGPESAFVMEDADVSRVVYVDMPCPNEPFWTRIDAEPGDVVYISLGVPVLDELRAYRPTLHFLAPDLPAPRERIPLQIPQGFGAITIPTDTVTAPRVFHEPHTGTDSWVLLEHRHVVVRRGSYYVVVEPPPASGRFWLTSGTAEEAGDLGALLGIPAFFDASGAQGLGLSCEENEVAIEGGGAACSIDRAAPARSGPGVALALTVALGLAIRRRRARRPA